MSTIGLGVASILARAFLIIQSWFVVQTLLDHLKCRPSIRKLAEYVGCIRMNMFALRNRWYVLYYNMIVLSPKMMLVRVSDFSVDALFVYVGVTIDKVKRPDPIVWCRWNLFGCSRINLVLHNRMRHGVVVDGGRLKTDKFIRASDFEGRIYSI